MKTPLFNEHKNLGAKIAPFGGWDMPIQYTGILAEHHHTRQKCSLFDICHMGEFVLSGAAAADDLNRLITQQVNTLAVGQCRYGYLLNEQGGVIDDLTCYRLGEQSFYLVVNAATCADDAAWIKSHLSGSTQFNDVSSATAKLDVQGPASRSALEALWQITLPELGYFRAQPIVVHGIELLLSRTGYTGEWGYELYFPSDQAVAMWQELLTSPDIEPAGLGARDTLRLEMGYALYGHELTADQSPLSASSGAFIDWHKEFIGREALVAEKERGCARVLVGLELPSRRAARHGDEVQLCGSRAGWVTSGSFSPSLGKAVAMAYIDREISEPLQEVTICARGAKLVGSVCSLPFYKAGTARRLQAR